MVGRPNFPEDVDDRDDLKGAASSTPGLSALDEEREASLADEGGASGMHVETQDLDDRRHMAEALPVSHLTSDPPGPERSGSRMWAAAGVVMVAAVGAAVARRLLR